jgi:cytochrome d ubiquinol oxidase subunit I
LSKVVSSGQVLFSLILFSLIYLLLFVLFIFLLDGKIRKGPEDTGDTSTEYEIKKHKLNGLSSGSEA